MPVNYSSSRLWFISAFLIIVALGLGATTLWANDLEPTEDSIGLTIRPGQGTFAQPTPGTPTYPRLNNSLLVTVDNRSQVNRTLNLSTHFRLGKDTPELTMSQSSLNLPSLASRSLWLPITPMGYDLTVKVSENGRIICRQTLNAKLNTRSQGGIPLISVAAPQQLPHLTENFLKSAHSFTWPHYKNDETNADVQASFFAAQLSELPETAQLLEGLTLLVVVAPEKQTPSQQNVEAIKNWVIMGGQLLLISGSTNSAAQIKLPAAWQPLQDILPIASKSQIFQVATPLDPETQTRLLMRSCGAGVSAFITGPQSTEQLIQLNNWSSLLKQYAQQSDQLTQFCSPILTKSRAVTMQTADIPWMRYHINWTVIAWGLALYVIIAGPFNWFVNRRYPLRFPLTVAATAIVFAILLYIYALHIHNQPTFRCEEGTIISQSGSREAIWQGETAFYTLQAFQGTLTVPPAGILRPKGGANIYSDFRCTSAITPQGLQLNNFAINKWNVAVLGSAAPIVLNGTINIEPQQNGSVKVSNTSDIALEDCRLCLEEKLSVTFNLPAGTTQLLTVDNFSPTNSKGVINSFLFSGQATAVPGTVCQTMQIPVPNQDNQQSLPSNHYYLIGNTKRPCSPLEINKSFTKSRALNTVIIYRPGVTAHD